MRVEVTQAAWRAVRDCHRLVQVSKNERTLIDGGREVTASYGVGDVGLLSYHINGGHTRYYIECVGPGELVLA